jgi:hypothetical protein
MKKITLRGSKTFWLAVPKGPTAKVEDPRCFTSRAMAEHMIDHRTEGWDGWKLLQVAAFAEHRP